MKEIEIKLRRTEITDLLSHLHRNHAKKMYWGNKEQFYRRQEGMITKLSEALEELDGAV